MKASELKELRDLLSNVPDKIPKGWFSREEICQKLNIKSTTCKIMIRKAVEDGRMERRTFLVRGIYQNIRKPYYKINAKGKTR